MIAKCIECNKLSKAQSQVKKLNRKIQMHYYQCEHCNHEYVICYTDQQIRKMQAQIRRLIKLNNRPNADKYKLNRKIEALNKDIVAKMDELDKKMGA